MTQVLHAIEEKIIKALKEYGTSDMTKLLTRTDLGEERNFSCILEEVLQVIRT